MQHIRPGTNGSFGAGENVAIGQHAGFEDDAQAGVVVVAKLGDAFAELQRAAGVVVDKGAVGENEGDFIAAVGEDLPQRRVNCLLRLRPVGDIDDAGDLHGSR